MAREETFTNAPLLTVKEELSPLAVNGCVYSLVYLDILEHPNNSLPSAVYET